MKVERFANNPIITPADVPPSRPDFEVVCAFNAGAIRYNGETLLMLRVAECPAQTEQFARVPVINCEGESPRLEIIELDKSDTSIDFRDPRVIYTPTHTYLTTISHLRLARSTDGCNFTVEPQPALFPDRATEAFGLEDPRLVEIEGRYFVIYKSVGAIGITVSLAETKDFVTYERKGVIFCPENLDVCIFPEKVNGRYAALHRPVSKNLGQPNMWMAYSHDLLTWGDHHFVMGIRPNSWDSGRIGASAIPIKTAYGWLEIYHGATPEDRYCLGAVLLDLDEPHKVIARGTLPIMEPEAKYETEGFLGNVIFSCGTVADGDTLTIYYGAADHVMAGANLSISEILNSLVPEKVPAIS